MILIYGNWSNIALYLGHKHMPGKLFQCNFYKPSILNDSMEYKVEHCQGSNFPVPILRYSRNYSETMIETITKSIWKDYYVVWTTIT